MIEYVAGDRIRTTPPGRAAADAPDVPLTNAALHEAVLARLNGPQRRILQPLLDAYPEPVRNDDLARAAGYAVAGAFNNPKGRLRSLGLIEYLPDGVRARDLLFPEGA